MIRSLEAYHNKIWISCILFTVLVETEWGIITVAAPFVRNFIGQRIHNLIKWSTKFGEARYEILGDLCRNMKEDENQNIDSNV